MYNIERKSLIVDLLEKNHTVSVSNLAEMLNMSKETVRRDLRELEQEGMIKRTHGGAVLVPHANNVSESPFAFREIKHYAEKNRICEKAAEYIQDGDTIFVDNSSTSINLLRYINPSYQVTVVTSSIRLLMEAASLDNHNLTMISLGGIFRAKNYSLSGVMSLECIKNFRPKLAFLSCHSIRPETGLSDGSIYEVETKRALIDSAQTVYILADHSKFKENGFVYLSDFSKIETIITDDQVSSETVRQIENKGVKVVIVS